MKETGADTLMKGLFGFELCLQPFSVIFYKPFLGPQSCHLESGNEQPLLHRMDMRIK